jgi:two-component system response regulator AlgR
VKILVVDDEPLARERLLRLLARIAPGASCLEAANGEQAMAVAAGEDLELLLLDICMPGMDGIEVAAQLARRQSPPAIIFCTAYDEYALQALRHQAVAYLLKPVREAELARALAAARRVNRMQLAALRDAGGGARTSVSSNTHRGFESLPVEQVRCFIAEQKYVTAMTPEESLLLPDTLKELEAEFGDEFIRVHRNALVGLRYVERLEKKRDGSWRVVLEGLTLAPAISRRHLSQVKQRFAGR